MLRPLGRLPVELSVRPAAVVDPGESGQHRSGGAHIAADCEAVGEIDPSRSFTLNTLKKRYDETCPYHYHHTLNITLQSARE